MNLHSFSIQNHSNVSEATCHKLFYNDDDVLDIADLTGKTPFDELMAKEERDTLDHEDYRQAQIEALSGLLSFLFKRTKKDEEPSPKETAIRLWLLTYTMRPELIGARTLAQIGVLFEMTGQNLSKRLIKQNDETGLRARNRKSESARKKYSKLTTARWREKKRK